MSLCFKDLPTAIQERNNQALTLTGILSGSFVEVFVDILIV